MSSNEAHSAGPENQEQYEATVLDFLDKEMASVQTGPKKDKQLDELDALVSDLLKQAITEADKPGDGSKILKQDNPLLDAEDELFAGVGQEEKAIQTAPEKAQAAPKVEDPVPAPKPAKPAPPPKAAVAEAAPKPEEAPSKAKNPVPALNDPKSPATPLSGITAKATKSKMPLIAAAAIGLIVIIGAAVYFFSRSGDAPSNAMGSAATQETATPANSTSQPVAPVSTIPEKPATAAANPAAIAAPPLNSKPALAPKTVVPAPAKGKTEATPAAAVSTPPPPVKEEKPAPAAAQPVVSTPPPASAAAEKPAPVQQPPAQPAAPEKKQMAAAPVPAPAAEHSAPAPQPVRNLIPALPLSQASPVFPEMALRTRTSGSVVLELQIDEQGKVTKATPVSGPAIFYNSAITAATKWRYKPASIGGVNVRSQSRITLDFNLKK